MLLIVVIRRELEPNYFQLRAACYRHVDPSTAALRRCVVQFHFISRCSRLHLEPVAPLAFPAREVLQFMANNSLGSSNPSDLFVQYCMVYMKENENYQKVAAQKSGRFGLTSYCSVYCSRYSLIISLSSFVRSGSGPVSRSLIAFSSSLVPSLATCKQDL